MFIPFTVGGGIRTVDDARRLLRAGADKVSVNTAAVERPELVREIADEFGAQCVVVAIDARAAPDDGGWEVFTHGGRTPTGLDAVAWAAEVVSAGRGRDPADLDGPRRHRVTASTSSSRDRVAEAVQRPGHRRPAASARSITSSRASTEGKADAVLAASIFHFGEHTVREAKEVLAAHGITVATRLIHVDAPFGDDVGAADEEVVGRQDDGELGRVCQSAVVASSLLRREELVVLGRGDELRAADRRRWPASIDDSAGRGAGTIPRRARR